MAAIVSIITPYLNAELFIPRFVAAIQSQTRNDWICIMVDDGSTDNGTLKLQRLVSTDCRFILVKNTFRKCWPGPASARNCALSHVETPLVAFCDVDDIWHPQKLEYQLAFHTSHNLDISVTSYGRFFNNKLNEPLPSKVTPPYHLSLDHLRGRNPIPMLTVLIRTPLARSGFLQIAHEDFLFWLQLFRSYPEIRYGCYPALLSFYCIHSGNVSARKVQMPIWTYRVFRTFGYSRLRSLSYLVSWIVDHVCLRLNPMLRRPSSFSVAELLEMPPLHLPQAVLSSR